jgi:hypothetical protein
MILYKFQICRDIKNKGIITWLNERGDITFMVDCNIHSVIWVGLFKKIDLHIRTVKSGVWNNE